MNRWLLSLGLVCAVLLGVGQNCQAEVHHRIGGGVHYWKTIDDIDVEHVDDSGWAYLISYQFRPAWLLKLEADLEMEPDYAGSDETMLAPEAYLIIGGGIYGGIGVGIQYLDGDFAEDPFFALRAGIDLEVVPRLFLDINGNYRFMNWDQMEGGRDINTDTITLGAFLRFQI